MISAAYVSNVETEFNTEYFAIFHGFVQVTQMSLSYDPGLVILIIQTLLQYAIHDNKDQV